ncbi:MAG TPA: hypothetical protein VKA55_07050, partial [Gammaproteobacteria bacterium]|nr:hypothetical protein [Gammaproteobacteria bacterium]
GVEKLLRRPSAALRTARSFTYLLDMPQSLRGVRLAYGLLATFFNALLSPDGAEWKAPGPGQA